MPEPQVSGWPLPDDIAELGQMRRVRIGAHAGRTLWLERRNGEEFFLCDFPTPELAAFAALACNRYIDQMQGYQR